MRPHILIVEDDFATRESLKKILEGEHYVVDTATDGEKAIGCLAQRRYDAVVLDLALPRLSGTDVMEYIASTNPAQLGSVVVVTGLDVADIRKLFPAVRETLSKPIMPTRFVTAVRRCLGATGHPNGLSGISVA